MNENILTIEQAVEKIEAGELTSEVIDIILDKHIEEPTDNKYLLLISNALVKFAKPVEWKSFESSLNLFAQATIENNQSIEILSPIFQRADMLEFTKSYFMSVSNFWLTKNPDRTVSILLYVSSRAAQNSPQFYTWAVRALFSIIATNLELVHFADLSSSFSQFIDFQPEATTEPLQQLMAERFKFMFQSLEDRNVDQTTNYANEKFLNLLKFFQPFAFKYDQYKSAFIILAFRSIYEEPSLKINPFRLKVIQILMDTGHYLECVAQLTKILSKSLQEKKSESVVFDWEKLIIADKEIARSSNYQDMLFDKSFDMLKTCLEQLKKRIAYPEIVAPVIRTIKTTIESPIFQSKQSVLKKFINEIERNVKLVEQKRQAIATAENFNITECLDI